MIALAGCSAADVTAETATFEDEHEQTAASAEALTQDVKGFTKFTASTDSRRIFVSSRTGSDTNSGLSEATPVATVAKALSLARTGYPDHVYFKRGDVWNEAFGQWRLSGRSAAEPMVIGAYGTGERPRFEFSTTAMYTNGGGRAPASTDYVTFLSLHFNGSPHDFTKRTPTGPNPECIAWLRPAKDITFEDVRFQYCQVNIQAEFPGTVLRWRFFRSQFLDSFSVENHHAQGIYLNGVSQMVIEESTFDYCGWHKSVPLAKPTIYNHCIYWQKDSPSDGVIKNNIILRAASNGMQLRSNGQFIGNVVGQAAIGGFLANDTATPSSGAAIGNVFTEGMDTLPREGHPATGSAQILRGWAFELIAGRTDGYRYEARDNIFSQCKSLSNCRTMPASFTGSTISNNTVWAWGKPASGELKNSTVSYVDPNRTLGSYNALQGGSNSFDAFATNVRGQSKTYWRTAYTAPAVIQYFKDGFRPR